GASNDLVLCVLGAGLAAWGRLEIFGEIRQPVKIGEVRLLKRHLALQPPKRDPGAEQQKNDESREAGPPSPDAEHGNDDAAEGVETSAETIVQDLAAVEGERHRP